MGVGVLAVRHCYAVNAARAHWRSLPFQQFPGKIALDRITEDATGNIKNLNSLSLRYRLAGQESPGV